MAFIDKVRFSLRQTVTTNENLNEELDRYVQAAISNLVNTTDIVAFDIESADPLIQDCVIAYCHYRFETDPVQRSSYKEIFDDLKTQISKSSIFSTLGGNNGPVS